MSIINSQPLIGASGQGGYFLTKSLRFRSSVSAYLNRTFTTPTSSQKFTWSGWVKRGKLDASGYQGIFSPYSSGTVYGYIDWSQDGIRLYDRLSGGTNYLLQTTAVYRDPSAWYHIVYAVDTTQATASNRVRLYVNGVEVTSFSTSTYPTQNNSTTTNSAIAHYIGYDPSNTGYLDGYLTEVNFIDGQALTPSSFGQTDSATGVWQPAKYTGTYGTNGFYLPFTNTTSTSTLGNDFSGNSNTWTVNNISLTSGSTYDSMKDVPTLTDTDTANYCVLNPLRGGSLSNANLTADTGNSGSANAGYVTSTIWLPSSGKFYFEVTPTTVGDIAIGLTTNSNSRAALYYRAGDIYINGSITTTQSSYTNNDVIGVAVDISAATVQFYKNNTAQGSAQSISAITTTLVACLAQLSSSGTAVANANFGQQPFAYTPPTGFVALNTFNLPTPTIGATASSQAGKYFNPVLYTGNSSGASVTGVGFAPEFIWTKSRSNTTNHELNDIVRGGSSTLFSNVTNAEATQLRISTFGSDGWTYTTDSNSANTGYTYVGWCWKANGSGSSNTDGSITSTVSANTTAGFSIVTFTGSSGAYTLGHGLGVAPKMIIYKNRQSSSDNWVVMHTSLSNMTDTFLRLNTTDASGTFGTSVSAPTSTTIGCSVSIITNGNTAVAYCFAQVAGYSAFGSYTGNGSSDGTFVYTGFRPKFIMIKRTDSTANWRILDTARDTYNVEQSELYPNLSNAEGTFSSLDGLSNGFKIRNSDAAYNASGGTYIYMAFAESPFKYSLAR